MILLVDNYDSFTFNLYQALAGLGAEVVVHRNDALSVDEALQPLAQRVEGQDGEKEEDDLDRADVDPIPGDQLVGRGQGALGKDVVAGQGLGHRVSGGVRIFATIPGNCIAGKHLAKQVQPYPRAG